MNKDLKEIYSLPRGVKVYFSDEADLKRDIENRIIETLQKWGYDSIVPPTFGFYNNLVKIFDKTFQNKVYKFVDRDGEVLALRPDFTAQIVRLIATSLKNYIPPIRIAYSGNVFLQSNREEGNLREYYQAGVEYFDDKNKIDESELIMIIFELMASLGIENFTINIGNVAIINRIIEQNNLVPVRNKIIEALALRNYDELLKITDSKKIAELVHLIGDASILDKASNIFPEAEKEILYLKKIYEQITAEDKQNKITFDLAEFHSLPYYSSVVFETYIYGIGTKVISGGRYDNLCQNYGVDLGGAGFAINIDKLLEIFNEPFTKKQKLLIIGERDFELEQNLRAAGKVVEYISENELNSNVLIYAKKRGIEKVIILSESKEIYDVSSEERRPFSLKDIVP